MPEEAIFSRRDSTGKVAEHCGTAVALDVYLVVPLNRSHVEQTKNEDNDPKRSLGQVSLPRRRPYSISTREVLPTDAVDTTAASAKKISP